MVRKKYGFDLVGGGDAHIVPQNEQIRRDGWLFRPQNQGKIIFL